MKKIIIYIFLSLVVFILMFFGYINLSWDKNLDAPYPKIVASNDSSIVELGSYLVYGPAHCAYCHVPTEQKNKVVAGEKIPLSGGTTFNLPIGTFTTPNLTPDEETGIGNISDEELARSIRYSVNHNNKLMFPFMLYQDLTDEHLTAIISFLRSQKPIFNDLPSNEYNLLGKIYSSLGFLKQVTASKNIAKTIAKDSTKEYGKYLVNSVANCIYCHTNQNMKTGEFISKPFAGGRILDAEPFSGLQKGYEYITPNLTTDNETGIMAFWSEKDFIRRFKSGRIHVGSPMPWEAFARMDEVDMKAIYRYLKSLEPVRNKINRVYR